ncbi:uncharacterized protein LY79DRAFT_137194 [Colletotrichum navitas]|uniref:Uncharacterized protein n=1 Tax=Colletotrichum navitas TaxID=681940 RepID=A0AAD8QC51_9PEZI|nr:uncharacterized protein LY79DRAFT_137194 [Colletotrichum navitas]KAK1599276.1 hypothetical protein LY79DRAFT_137194 [Colletotrichum navitas]
MYRRTPERGKGFVGVGSVEPQLSMEGPRPNLPSLPLFHRNAPEPKPTTMAARQNHLPPPLSTGGKGKRSSASLVCDVVRTARFFLFLGGGGGGGGFHLPPTDHCFWSRRARKRRVLVNMVEILVLPLFGPWTLGIGDKSLGGFFTIKTVLSLSLILHPIMAHIFHISSRQLARMYCFSLCST